MTSSVHAPEPTAAAPRPTLGKTGTGEISGVAPRQFRAAPSFSSHWVVMDGFAPMVDEAYPRADLAEGRAAYLNQRPIANTAGAAA